MNYSEEQIEALIANIYAGVVDEYNLPKDLYKAIGEYLESECDQKR